jgi:uncharacterized protein YbjT (DUF2867 family)
MTDRSTTQVTVFGATGGTGRRVVELLRAEGPRGGGGGAPSAALEALAAEGCGRCRRRHDRRPAPAVAGSQAVVWALGVRFGVDDFAQASRSDRDGAIAAYAAAQAAGARRWVQISSLMADRPEFGPPFLKDALVAKGEADEALALTDLAWTVLRPGGLNDEPGTGLVTMAPRVDGHAMVPRDDLAAVAVAALSAPQTEGLALDLIGGGLPVAEALAALA